ncbi:histone deacetylase family protein [Magnetovibrio sp.]|uniref:histone deacetylase family protein n=1 Tax=Magnetovibrio sp. TaxID=2024836 RepID=UPI002F93FF55
MATVLYQPPACLNHDTGDDHPEHPLRHRAIASVLENERYSDLVRAQAKKATRAQLERVHSSAHIDYILSCAPQSGVAYLDSDTAISTGSVEAALFAAGAACEAVDDVMNGLARNAFCAIRPPGHHAEPNQAMGFCLFNNAAIAAAHARHEHGLTRIAIVDFDVHHGNGSQAFCENDPHYFYASSHQYPCWPDTGLESETGIDGNVVNATLAPGAGSDEFRAAWSARILPKLARFHPELLIVSAGFDAHESDPQAHLRLQTGDFAWITAELVGLANQCCQGKVVSVLEGGYDLRALAASVGVHVHILMTE